MRRAGRDVIGEAVKALEQEIEELEKELRG
jgi:hypothetical protein